MEGWIDRLHMKQSFGLSKSKKLWLPTQQINFFDNWEMHHYRNGHLINIQKIIGNDHVNGNGITNAGKNYLFNAGFVSGSQIPTGSWYLGLVDNTSFGGSFSSSDTMGSHGSWLEFTGYSETTRPAWGQVTSTAQLLTNPSVVVFTISVSGNLQGAFVIGGNNTKGGTTGTLWATGSYTAVTPVAGGTDEIKLIYNLAA